ncbi:TetR/AcrR family transcriptional regulator [Solimonas sp. K1W22B-7]|uniref:TetR/AcrR family transcriptional regulator n=1 Tax=Solimonas sp. K1W22B-7 TaxID=2303331 RepID=UPI000E336A27|nr:TetR/AcrR family transcriptional regulator [Solimonas sp. K1W22B-7]AXQ30089.1 TetR/AcrR family transcriptional regulator [Solimonas sp. K1W22B-7]
MSRPPRLTDRKRESILKAALQEFLAQGFDGTSMDRIAASAEVSKRTVYNHFPSKDELFEAILRKLWECATAQVAIPYAPRKPLREQLSELLWQKMRLMQDSGFMDLARVALSEGMRRPDRARELIARLDEGEREEAITAWIRAASADGKLKPLDADFAEHQLHALVKGAAFWPQLTMGAPALTQKQQAQVVEGAVEMFLRCYAKKL